ncbi:MAG: hypothetical protein JO290_12690 [Sphingomonadaceae bacterium]|nr:hypothetical protein [Sphingomonadaceae bacterium]
MSSTSYREWTSRRWRPTVPQPDPARLALGRRVARWQMRGAIGLIALVALQLVAGLVLYQGHRSALLAVMQWLALAILAQTAGIVLVAWWLYWRMDRVAGGNAR